jgi:hypothetical protein
MYNGLEGRISLCPRVCARFFVLQPPRKNRREIDVRATGSRIFSATIFSTTGFRGVRGIRGFRTSFYTTFRTTFRGFYTTAFRTFYVFRTFCVFRTFRTFRVFRGTRAFRTFHAFRPRAFRSRDASGDSASVGP